MAVRVLAALAVIGCATPYQARGFSGGYSEQRLGNGRWSVTFDGNSYTSEGTVMAYSHRRASELCPGGYDVVDANRETGYLTMGKNTYAKPGSTIVVQCRGVAPTGHWCSVKPDGHGVCAPQPGACEVYRGKMNAATCSGAPGTCEPAYRGCEFRQRAICAPSGCFTTPAMCADFERHRGRDGSACAVR